MENEFLISCLMPGETILWSGSPTRKVRIARQHIPQLWMLLTFCTFLLVPVVAGFLAITEKPPVSPNTSVTVITSRGSSEEDYPPTQHKQTPAARISTGIGLIALFGGVFALLVLSTIQNVWGGAFMAKSTLYSVTDQRIVIVTGQSKKEVTSFLLSTLTQVQMKQWPDGLEHFNI